MTLFRVTAPANYPVDLQEVKDNARITLDTEDDKIVLAMDAAVSQLDGWFGWLGRALITQTWELRLDRFADVIELPLPPLQSVSSIKYIDPDGTEQTLASSVYTVNTNREPGQVYLAYQQTWPSIRGDKDGVRIQYVCGYGANASSVPEIIRQWLLMRATTLLEYPDEYIIGSSIADTPFVAGMLENYRVR